MTIFQRTEQDNTSEKELNKMKMNSLPDKEFKVMVLKMLIRLRMDEHSEKINNKKENTKKNKSELKNTIIKIKNTLERTNCRLEDAEECIQ